MFTKVFRVGNTPEVRFTANNVAVASISLAYNYGRKDDGGKYPTQWVEGTLWGKQAEGLIPYIEKGSQLECSLSDLHIQDFESNGEKRSKMVGTIIAVNFVSGGKPSSNPAPKATKKSDNSDDMMDDDIPF